MEIGAKKFLKEKHSREVWDDKELISREFYLILEIAKRFFVVTKAISSIYEMWADYLLFEEYFSRNVVLRLSTGLADSKPPKFL
ncbi:unnamed protein product [Clavelina lepadiformis]|uniref:Uncharacterized protein n=1 Tax=Clavelina lepadiformis TaxID=159417 RepID=A0ABP0EUV2_CLALP